MKFLSPCKGCQRPEKELGCHDRCKDFLSFRHELDEFNALVAENKKKSCKYYKTKEEFDLSKKRKVNNTVFKQKRR